MLVDDWHPVAASDEAARQSVMPARLLGEDLVIWRGEDGTPPCAWRDLCVHRGTRLSLGKVENCTLRCPYHGWVYGADGQCVSIPAQPDVLPPKKARATTYRAVERYGLVWVSLGRPAHDVPPFPSGTTAASASCYAVPTPSRRAGRALSRTSSTSPTSPMSTKMCWECLRGPRLPTTRRSLTKRGGS